MSRTSTARLLAPFLLLVASAPARGQSKVLDTESYALPPKEILDAVNGVTTPFVSLTNLSPNGKYFLLTKGDGMPPAERVGKPHVWLAGLAFDPVARRAHDLWVRSYEGFEFFDPKAKTTKTVLAAKGTRFGPPVWSPEGDRVACLAMTDDATHVAVVDVANGSYRSVTKTPVLATLNTTLQWSKDGRRVLTVLEPEGAKAAVTSVAPKVRVHRPGPNPTRTIRYLLENPADAALLESLAMGQLALVDVTSGAVTKIGTPAMIRTASAAPGEGSFRVTEMKKPFSYYVLATSFGSLESIWDGNGKNLYTILDRKLRETEPTPPPVTVATNAPPAPGAGGAATPGAGGRGGANPAGGGGRGTRGGGTRGGATNPAAPATPPADPTAPPTDPTNPTVPTGPTDPTDPDAPRPFPTAPVDPDGKRDLAWRHDGLGLSYLQLEPAKDEKKDEKKAEPKTETEQDPPKTPAKDAKDAKAAPAPVRKDRVMLWKPPFGKDDATVVYETPDRIITAAYSEDGQYLFLTQVVNSQRQITAVDLKDAKKTYVVHRSGTPRTPPEPKKETAPMPKSGDAKKPEQPPAGRGGGARGGAGFGGAVGGVTLMTKPSRGGASVARVSKDGSVYVTGSDRAGGGGGGTSKPYLEKIIVTTGEKKRLFEGKGDMTETIDAVDGDEVSLVYTTKQKTDVPPDSYVTDVKAGTTTKLTNNVDRAPWAKDLKTDRYRVTRIDGFKFWVKVTVPKNASGKLPAMFWIYPREFTDQAQYDQRSGQGGAGGGPGGVGTGRFVTPGPRSMNMLCLLGYAVVEPDVPIVGPAGRMNDNYIPDLRNSLWAAIDELDKRGIIDRDRLACGGHSYGAFSTANAMAHTPFFKAGIAGDGNFNRTLTPMSFQTERRNLWDARETYLEMSPFLWANRINGALLMYHGLDDANVGTNPVNSEFLYMALDGLGKPCALYMYPGEGHGPIARETNLDLWARWCAWLDVYVKNPTPTKDEKPKDEKKEVKK